MKPVDTPTPERPELAVEDLIALNEEYAGKRLVPRARDTANAGEMNSQAVRRADRLARLYKIAGLDCLEIGCGRGETAVALAQRHRCKLVGVDVATYRQWAANAGENVSLREIDIATQPYESLGSFDFVYSFSVWEHIRHPFSALKAAYNLLRPGGRMFLYANLYRGPNASHRYREIAFPWPHLLFADRVFEEFYIKTCGKPSRPAWINKLVAAEYQVYFNIIGFETQFLDYKIIPIDETFYSRFEETLGRYPRFDLERDFIHAVVKRPENK